MNIHTAAHGKIHIILLLLLCLLVFLSGCQRGTKESSCVSCHKGIEHVSKTHGDCVSCHGGKPLEKVKEKAHQGVFGIGNPEYMGRWENGCAPCHRYQFERMQSNLMYTAAGIIRNTQLTWEGEDGNSYTDYGEKQFDADGKPFLPKPLAELDNISGELSRKGCAQCHLRRQITHVYGANHASGCAACHFPWNNEGVYAGNDKTMKGKAGHSATHTMSSLPDTQVCSRCHNRSGRIAYSYQGLYDGNNGFVPTLRGEGGPVKAGSGRNLTHITADVHFAAGMECIDCHTSRDVMGDGFAYRNMYLQTEVACEDCHGGAKDVPRYREITRENEEALRESRNYKRPASYGMKMIQTSKGRNYS
ncbi:MAG: cytochrome C, partial [Deltaproteobacteria bacterium]|nr:cytochrome C [Deltaproteobacteria bacterium]